MYVIAEWPMIWDIGRQVSPATSAKPGLNIIGATLGSSLKQLDMYVLQCKQDKKVGGKQSVPRDDVSGTSIVPLMRLSPFAGRRRDKAQRRLA